MISQAEVIMSRKANLEAYLHNRGYELEQEGLQCRVKAMSGLFVTHNLWYWHSKQQGGNAIDYLMQVEGLSFLDAITALVPYRSQVIDDCTEPVKGHPIFSPPPRNSSNSRVIAYLLKTRRIKSDVLFPLIRKNLVYESADTHNVVFLGRDSKGKDRYAFERSSASCSSVKFETCGSDKRYSFTLGSVAESGIVMAFESCIDILSFLSLPDTIKPPDAVYVSLGGLTDIALRRHAATNPKCKIVLCLDNDKAGADATNRLKAKWLSAGHHVSQLVPEAKDWNALLTELQ